MLVSQVDCVNFTVLGADEISTYSEVEVFNQNNYDARSKNEVKTGLTCNVYIYILYCIILYLTI